MGAGEDVKKLESSFTTSGHAKWYNNSGKQTCNVSKG